MDKFFEFLKQIQPKFLTSSKLGKAISYALNAEEYVRNYLLDPELGISNNRGERMIKHFVIEKNNFLFSNTRRGAHSSSILYCL